MSNFKPRKGQYIQFRSNAYWYRRDIPKAIQSVFGRTQWLIKLEGETAAERNTEAQALAHKHNQEIKKLGSMPKNNPGDGSISMRFDFSETSTEPEFRKFANVIAPFEFFRDGKLIRTQKFAISRDPEYLREAEADGFFAITYDEGQAQLVLAKLMMESTSATGDRAELIDLKSDIVKKDIVEISKQTGDNLKSILPRMHDAQGQRQTARKAHYRAVSEFTETNGVIPLTSIKKAHVVAYVDAMRERTIDGKPLAPTTIRQRLAAIKAILQFALSLDLIDFNPAAGVVAPKDTRSLVDQTYTPFEKAELKQIVKFTDELWGKRNFTTPLTKQHRASDLMTTLRILIWTGARPEEICQLRVNDIDLDQRAIFITNASDEIANQRQTKNEASVRVIPIHSKLMPVLEKHFDGDGLLFPSFEPGTKDGRFSRVISHEWSFHVRPIVNDRAKVLYSLRHTWARESMSVGMPELIRNQIMGHTNTSTSASAKRYISGFENLANKLIWIEKMNLFSD
jgi:integrase